MLSDASDPTQLRLIRLLSELAETLDRPDRCDSDQPVERLLLNYSVWLQSLSRGKRAEEPLIKFWQRLKEGLRGLRQPHERFVIGAAYLDLNPYEGVGIFRDLLEDLDANASIIANWMVADRRKLPEGRGRSLALFLMVAERRNDRSLELAFECAEKVVMTLLQPDDRRNLLRQIHHYLDKWKALGWVRRRLRERLDQLKRSGPRY
jgi:hypothetical protein